MRTRKPAPPPDEFALYDYAVKLLGQQMRTVAELKRLLRRRVGSGEGGEAALAAVVAKLKEYKFLDDTGYARDYAKLRQENSSFGSRRVRLDLMRKGVHAEVIAKTLDAAYEGVPEEALARRHLERKRISKPANDKEIARVARLLIRAGFSPGTIFRILKQWNVRETALASLESIDAEDRAPEE
ncbi:MAG TPA: regulatory protein RecX [Acidobacteriaceae bacterium]|nr:regulatory protein RecX [Acidobacteriaceae bacterium]